MQDAQSAVHGDGDDVIDLGALLGTLWRGKWIIAVIAMLATVIGGYYAYGIATPRYTATSVVILETQERSVVDIESVMGGLSSDSQIVNSEAEVLKSRGLIGKVVDRLDLTADPEFNSALRDPSALSELKSSIKSTLLGAPSEQVVPEDVTMVRQRNNSIDSVLENMTVAAVPNSLVFNIRVTSLEPEKAALIADTIAELYILNQLEVKFEATQEATSWLTEQVGELRVELESGESRLAELSADNELVSVEALQALERQLKEIRDRVTQTADNLETQKARLAVFEAASTREEQAAAANDMQLTRMLPRAQNEPAMATAFDTRFTQLAERARLDVARTSQQLEGLRTSESDLRARIDQQGDDLVELQQLQREVEASRALYEYFLGRLKETSAQQGIQQADSRVLSNAVIPINASEPRRSLILAMSGMLGLMIGAGLVLLKEARNSSFRTSDELEAATGISVIGQIPRIPARNRRKTIQYLRDKPTSNTAEAYRNLRTSLMLSNVDNPPKVIVSTSALPGEGKTTNSIAIAQNLIGMGKKVLLMEGDIRRRTLSQYFDDLPKRGLVSVLSGDSSLDDVITQTEASGIDLLAGEQTSANAADLFTSDKFRDLITDLRGKYDAIILDTPPVLIVPDARIIAMQADAVLFTVKWDATSQAQVKEGLKLFRQSDQKVTGLVLSQINPKGMKRYGYGGKYGAYSAYGSGYYNN
ncbi:polysaccharide biosynthesis tyrosine autokinase [Oceanicola sp. D3]|uniref:polysaccharide biosynthesis tyrosine autokinase n=1 Tax=Oceanicola sp. D3 TaxID=2587163 RepID=UPI0020C7D0A7|nr:polysaccharide biosynthesis tyrosine autokinase [Oceanicola sp. D3]